MKKYGPPQNYFAIGYTLIYVYAFLFSGGNIPPYQEFAVFLFFRAKIGPNTE